MQTDKKEDRNPFFFRKSLMTVLLHLPEGRMCLRQPAGCHHAVLSPYSPTPYYIYTFQFPAMANTGRGQTTAIVKSFRLFRK